MGQIRSEVALRGQGIRQKLFVVFAIASVIPLIIVLYTGLPFIHPSLATSPLYPRDRIFFWVIVFFLSALELLGLYILVDLVRGVSAVASAVAVPWTAPRPWPTMARTDEVGVLTHEFMRLLDTIRQQAAQVQAHAAKVEQLNGELRAANDQLRESALTDELTQIGNRRHLHGRLREEVSRCTRFGHPFTLLSLDVDGLQAFRDRRGAPEADKVLQRIAGLLRSLCRGADVPCRVEGEEFALLLPETPKKGGVAVAERVRRVLDGAVSLADPGTDGAVSIGVAAFPDDGTDPEDLFEQAGAARQVAKREGGNRISAAPGHRTREG